MSNTPRKIRVFHIASEPAQGNTGRTVYVRKERCEALFHQFAIDYEESESGSVNFPCAIIELPDGKIEAVRADFIQFIEPSQG